ncbi:hypothetical protein N7466_009692 [Penicillium verhagenii]|uniref:uncharacterized protein n=1 Tax=Penicillium verhagenii TaxID=1562060 RepID=UPI002545A274|nr:uncharacterized protein N7466_009692 [Penicillium verhagenii]KAJ5921366.1 hypothetical protein N7466_009692 [Penicillium verhagenii]
MPSQPSMDDLIAPLDASTHLNEENRVRLQDSLFEAAEALETPNDMLYRLLNQGRQMSMIKIGYDLDIFSTLTSRAQPYSVKELAAPKNADPLLMARLLRFFAANRMISETSQDHFTGNKYTKGLSDPRIQGGLLHGAVSLLKRPDFLGLNSFHISNPTWQSLPEYLQENNYENTTGGHCAWHKSANTDLDFFPWAKQNPDILKYFQQLMGIMGLPRDGSWLGVIPIGDQARSIAGDVDSDRKVFVDIAGSVGHQCARLLTQHPGLAGRVVLQDLEETFERAPKIQGVDFMVYDFFTEQPVKGAKYYYLRMIIHDWEDDKAVQILKNIVPAMAEDSQILIDDIVLPNTGAHWWSTCMDMQMYIMHGAMERTVDQWHALLDRAGLKVVDIKTYGAVMRNSVIVAVPK